MANTQWQIGGNFFGNCSCDYLRCPCPSSSFTEMPSKGWCMLMIVFHVDQGHFGDVSLDDLSIAMVAHIPGIMADGNWSLGLIVDERATPEQQQALVSIMGGQAGGPMAAASSWVANFLGLEVRPIEFKKSGTNHTVVVPGLVDYATEAVPGANPQEPVYFDNLPHPVNSRIALGKGTRSHLHVFGIDWDGDARNFGVFAPFNWQVS
jgi:hypothetical protein